MIQLELPTTNVPLRGQTRRVYDVLALGGWWTLPEICERCGGLTTSLSARLRDLRNKHGYIVARRLRGRSRNLYEYRLEGRRHE